MEMTRFKVGDHEYQQDEFGVVHQLPPFDMPSYDVEYVRSRYDTIPELVSCMSHLRAGYVIANCRNLVSVLDVGYGNGSFLKVMKEYGVHCAGTDVTEYPVPEGCERVSWVDVMKRHWGLVTFFDSLEHFIDLGWMKYLRAEFVAVTAPFMPPREMLAEWKHLRPGEHLHHFDPFTLEKWMKSIGFVQVARSNIEDIIRKSENGRMNTFTSIFKRE
jgi:hypothetical protein